MKLTDNGIFEKVFQPLVEDGNYLEAVAILVELHKHAGLVYSEDLHITVKQLAIQKAAMVRSEAMAEGVDHEEAFNKGLGVLHEIYDLLKCERDDL